MTATWHGMDEIKRGAGHEIDSRTLRFREPLLETRYQEAYLASSLPLVRAALLLGAALFAMFGALDFAIARDTLHGLWAIRYGVACPALLGAYALTRTALVQQYHQVILSFAMIVAGLCIIAMTVVASMPAAHLYYAGLILVVIYCTTLFRLYFIYAAAISVFLFQIYAAAAAFINPIPSGILLSNSFILAVVVGVGVVISYMIDGFLRRLFAQNVVLEEAHREAEELKVKAQEANRAKSTFLAMMSHELRTPLTAIAGFSEMIRDEILGPLQTRKYCEYARDIHNSSNFLHAIIDDILNVSEAEAGELRLNEREIDFHALVEEVMCLFRKDAAERGIDTRCVLPRSPVRLLGDERLLRQLLVNLVTNGLKFTKTGGQVAVTLSERSDGAYELMVSDTGCGIPADQRERIFQPFVQLSDPLTRQQVGAGLGLPLVQRIAELHGAELSLDTEVGRGSVFRVAFPVERFAEPSNAHALRAVKAS